jgi:ParB family chromosome partitioning protein
MGHGKTLVNIENREDQLNIYEKILTKSLSVRDTEKLTNRTKNTTEKSKTQKKWLEEPFESSLVNLKKGYNSEVKIKLNGNEKGLIIIPFNNIDEFNKLNKKLNESK